MRDARYSDLDFNAPLSDAHAKELVASLAPLTKASIVDLGCGWAELLLRILETEPTAHGVGIDSDEIAIARARVNADARGLRDRTRLELGDASVWSTTADVVIVIGASHAWGGTQPALDAVRSLLAPGGRVLLGECFWEQPPSAAALAAVDAQPDEFGRLGELVDTCRHGSYRLLASSTASLEEWDSFESRFLAGWERGLRANPDDPTADDERAAIGAHRSGWLRGYRGMLGFAYLTLAVAD